MGQLNPHCGKVRGELLQSMDMVRVGCILSMNTWGKPGQVDDTGPAALVKQFKDGPPTGIVHLGVHK